MFDNVTSQIGSHAHFKIFALKLFCLLSDFNSAQVEKNVYKFFDL